MFTSAQNAFWQAGTVTTATGTATVTVNTSTTFQTFTGFGGAFNELGWQNLQLLSAQNQAAVLTALFDPNNGANFVYGRIPIGGNDYATTRYTDDETAGDTSMTSFSITEDQKFLIPYVKAALAVNPKIQLWGSAWTPPTWMKMFSNTATVNTSLSCAHPSAMVNGKTVMDTSAFDGGCMNGTAANLAAYALYLSKWVQAYAAQSLPITMVVPQNEPSYAQGYPSCLWDPAVYDTFVKTYLGPQFKGTSTQIFLGTMSKGEAKPGDVEVLAQVVGDPSAMSFVKGFALQWNQQQGNNPNPTFAFSPGSTDPNPTVANAVMTSGLPVWQTEHRAGNYPFGNNQFTPSGVTFNSTTAPNDYPYAIESWGLITAWLRLNVSSYSAWNMVLDTNGVGNDTLRNWPQDALITVDTSKKTATLTPAYFVFRHFSQYVQPGAVRVATSGALDTIAFKNPDGSIVTILYNSGSSAAQTTLSAGGSEVQFTVPAGGFATVVK